VPVVILFLNAHSHFLVILLSQQKPMHMQMFFLMYQREILKITNSAFAKARPLFSMMSTNIMTKKIAIDRIVINSTRAVR
jgi:hypothetical protein